MSSYDSSNKFTCEIPLSPIKSHHKNPIFCPIMKNPQPTCPLWVPVLMKSRFVSMVFNDIPIRNLLFFHPSSPKRYGLRRLRRDRPAFHSLVRTRFAVKSLAKTRTHCLVLWADRKDEHIYPSTDLYIYLSIHYALRYDMI